jgi:hypothetical protein
MEDHLMTRSQGFERLRGAAARIADHPEVAEKQAVLAACLADIEARYAQGSLDLAERSRLVAILLGLDAHAISDLAG